MEASEITHVPIDPLAAIGSVPTGRDKVRASLQPPQKTPQRFLAESLERVGCGGRAQMALMQQPRKALSSSTPFWYLWERMVGLAAALGPVS